MKGNRFGEMLKGVPKSEEWKAKASAAWTPERREALRQRMKGNKFGPGHKPGAYKHDEEARRKISESRAGRIFRKDGLGHRDPKVMRAQKLKYRYHFSPEIYEKMLADQDGHCALCPATEGYNGRLLSVDHDHKCCGPMKHSGTKGERALCGKCFRGLLCDSCNNIIGKLESLDTGWAERALAYLSKHAVL